MDTEQLLGSTVEKVCEDLLHPSVEAAGQIVSLPIRAVRIALTPLFKWVMQGEANLEEIARLVAEKAAVVADEKLVEPESYVAVPALQAISYSKASKELRNMYANLLARAINADEKDKVHPAYVEIIKQMSPLDAIALEHIQKDGRMNLPMCSIRFQEKSSQFADNLTSFRAFKKGIPIMNHLVAATEEGYGTDDITVSFENLNRLGLVAIMDDKYLDWSRYELFENPSIIDDYRHHAPPFADDFEFAAVPGLVEITTLGLAFSEICLHDLIANDIQDFEDI